MSKANDGKYLEEATRNAIQELSKKHPVKIERIEDAKTFGRATTNKEADFKGCSKGIPWLIECKSSDIEKSLRSCLSSTVKATQTAHHRLWHRAGGRSMFIFHSNAYDTLEIWDGDTVCKHRVSGTPLPTDGAICVGGLGFIKKALEHILLGTPIT